MQTTTNTCNPDNGIAIPDVELNQINEPSVSKQTSQTNYDKFVYICMHRPLCQIQ